MAADPVPGVWRGKWAEVTASFNSDDECAGDNGAEVSTAIKSSYTDHAHGNEIRRSARPRRIAAKAAQAEFSSLSGEEEDERPLKRRTSLSASATPSRGRIERRHSESHTRMLPSKLDEKRMRKRETNKNSARKMRLQRKEELNSLLHDRNQLQGKLDARTRDLRASQDMLHALDKNLVALDASYKALAYNHELLVIELVRHMACLRSLHGKPLDSQSLDQMAAQFAHCLSPEESVLLMGEANTRLSKAEGQVAEASLRLETASDEAADTVLIQVNPRPGTQVQVFRPKAMRAQSGDHAAGQKTIAMGPSQFAVTRPRTGPSNQPGTFSVPLAISPTPSLSANPSLPGSQATSFAKLLPSTGSGMGLQQGPQTPSMHAPLVRLASTLAEGSAALLKPSSFVGKDLRSGAEGPFASSNNGSHTISDVRAQAGSTSARAAVSPASKPSSEAHNVIRPQPRTANGTPSEGLVALPDSLDPLVSSVPYSRPYSQQAGANRIHSADSHLSSFQPVAKMA